MAAAQSNSVRLFPFQPPQEPEAEAGGPRVRRREDPLPRDTASSAALAELLVFLTSEPERWPHCLRQQILIATQLHDFARSAPTRPAEDWTFDRPLATFDHLVYRFSPPTDYEHPALYEAACSLRSAVEQTQRELRQVMAGDPGLTRIEVWPEETPFDPGFHADERGIRPLPALLPEMDGLISRVTRNGYLLGDRLLRRSRVVRYMWLGEPAAAPATRW